MSEFSLTCSGPPCLVRFWNDQRPTLRSCAMSETLVQATVDAAYDPAQVAHELAAIDPNASFERRLAEGVRILQNRLTSGPLAPEEIVSLLLDGLRNRSRQPGSA